MTEQVLQSDTVTTAAVGGAGAATFVAHAALTEPSPIVVGDRVRLSPQSPSHERYEIRIDRQVVRLADRLRSSPPAMTATAFQTPVWLAAWYATIGTAIGEPLLVTILESCSGEVVAILPLVQRTDGRLKIVEFADGGVSDNNGPILGPAAPSDPAGASALWTALRNAMPGVDLLRFTKMPATIDGRVNPLALIDSCHAASVNKNVVTIEESWEHYLKSLGSRFRREISRSWRVFSNHDGAAFERIVDADRAVHVLAELERQQSDHMKEQGVDYILDRPDVAAFYRKLLAGGLADGSVILTALTHGTEVVSALLGIVHGDTAVMLRISTGSREWSNCSPGRLLFVRTMQMLHAQGFRHFDFSIGNYDYKRRLGAKPAPLCDLVVALTPNGWPLQLWDRVLHMIRRNETLHALARLVARRQHSPEPAES